MYTIVGGDGKEYGPAESGQIRAWIAAGRANMETKAKAFGTEEWRRLGDFSDFNGGVTEAPPIAPPPESQQPFLPLPAGADARTIAEAMIGRASPLDIASCYERGWNLLKAEFWPLVGMGTLIFALNEIAGSVLVGKVNFEIGALTPRFFAGVTVATVLRAVLWGGMEYYILKKIRGQPATAGDAFAGFTRAFVPLMLSGLATTALSTAGLVLLLLPGIYLWVGYRFAYILVLDQRLGFWTAMEVSRRVITAQWWRILGLTLLAIPFFLLGLVAFLVGALIALPLVLGAMLYAYEDLCNPRQK